MYLPLFCNKIRIQVNTFNNDASIQSQFLDKILADLLMDFRFLMLGTCGKWLEYLNAEILFRYSKGPRSILIKLFFKHFFRESLQNVRKS